MIRIALTGHQKPRLRGHESEVSAWIKNLIDIYTAEGSVEMLCGCAEGSDELFGETAILYNYPTVQLTLCLPFRRYRWMEISKLMNRADKTVHMAEKWKKGADEQRDRYMVDNCDLLLAVWDGIEAGGAWKTIEYAKSKGKKIIYFPQEILYR